MMEGDGALSFGVLQEHLEKMTIDKIGYFPTLKNMKDNYGITLIFITYDLTKKLKVCLSYETYPDLSCITALRMSANFPLIFPRFKYKDSYYIDGGLCDNFPIEIAAQRGLRVLCFLLKQNEEESSTSRPFNMMEYLYDLVRIPINTILDMKIYTPNCTIITLSCGCFNILNIGLNSITKLELFSSGYRQCKEQLG